MPARHPHEVSVLLVDCHDSYTYNLYQLLATLNCNVTVVPHDAAPAPVRCRLLEDEYDGIVLGPGPGTPANALDAGMCLDLLREFPDLPIFGVCFGMQALAVANGGKVVQTDPSHGSLSAVRTHAGGHPLFAGIPSGFKVVRYHSLAVEVATLPDCLQPLAWAGGGGAGDGGGGGGGVLMALAHRAKPHFGVQYHPESVCTTHGRALMQNFLDIVTRRRSLRNLEARVAGGKGGAAKRPRLVGHAPEATRQTREVRLQFLHLPGAAVAVPSEVLFCRLYDGDAGGEDSCFWLDSASLQGGKSRFSFMGGKGGGLWQHAVYWAGAEGGKGRNRSLKVARADGATTVRRDTTIFDHIHACTAALALDREAAGVVPDSAGTERSTPAKADLPFHFRGGFVGYFGYELAAECGCPTGRSSDRPDAEFFFVDRFIAFDHLEGDIYVVGLQEQAVEHPWSLGESSAGAGPDSTREWMRGVLSTIEDLGGSWARGSERAPAPAFTYAIEVKQLSMAACTAVQAKPRHEDERYVELVQACDRHLRAGDSYEICLTNSIEVRDVEVDPLAFYLTLRRQNPAPYAAYLKFGKGGQTICSCSPERFLRCQGGVLEAKPIKGTAKRADDPEQDVKAAVNLSNSQKDRAENLMIVDLLRNDLGEVCEVGSVDVPQLMQIESFATVHQMVSTVVGQKRKDRSIVECIKAAFPPGSMTGAPKERTVKIISELEEAARGPYSGALGYIGLGDEFDLSVVIRTAVCSGSTVRIGAGGAITVKSDPAEELEEMKVKYRPIMRALEASQTRFYAIARQAPAQKTA